MSRWIGVDIGGAHIKVADIDGRAESHPFALWQAPTQLSAELQKSIGFLSAGDQLAITMTGELCDCYESKADGVRAIVAAIRSAFPDFQVLFYQVGGRFVDAGSAESDWMKTAASNWDALARWAARYLPGESGIVIDIGSTTTDIIPVRGGCPLTRGATDYTRMQHDELVYSGVARTPVSGVLHALDISASAPLPLAQELFATMLDVYLVRGNIPPNPENCQTADGRPADIPHARRRLARLLCADEDELGPALIDEIARQAAAAQLQQIAAAVQRVALRDWSLAGNWLVSGAGEWLARRIINQVAPRTLVTSLADCVSAAVCVAAPAWAVAHLAWESHHRRRATEADHAAVN